MEIKMLLEIIGLVALFLIFYYGITFYAFNVVNMPEGKYKTIDLVKLNPNNKKDKKTIRKFDIIEELKFLYSQKYLPSDNLLYKNINKTSYKDLKKYKGIIDWFAIDKDIRYSRYEYDRQYYYEEKDTYYTTEDALNRTSIHLLGIMVAPFLRKIYLPGYELYTILISVLFSMLFILLIPVLFF